MPVFSQITTLNVLQSQRAPEVSRYIETLTMDQSQLLPLILGYNMPVPTGRTKFTYHREDYVNTYGQFKGTTETTPGGTIVVDDGTLWAAGDVGQNLHTLECFRVTAASGNTLTVSRGYGSAAAANMTLNDDLLNLTNALADGSGVPPAKMTARTEDYNLVQVLRTPINLTMFAQRERQLPPGVDPLAHQRQRKLFEHYRKIELGLLFGQRYQDLSGNTELNTFGGLYEWITTNVTNVGGTLSETAFLNFLRDKAFNVGSSEKYLLAGSAVIGAINGFELNRKRQVETVTVLAGLSAARYESPYGTLFLLPRHLMFRNGAGGFGYNGVGLVIDPARLVPRYLPVADAKTQATDLAGTSLRVGIQPNDTLAEIDEYVTAFSLERRDERAFALLTGVTG